MTNKNTKPFQLCYLELDEFCRYVNVAFKRFQRVFNNSLKPFHLANGYYFYFVNLRNTSKGNPSNNSQNALPPERVNGLSITSASLES